MREISQAKRQKMNKPILIGDYSWKEAREILVNYLVKCESEQEFVKIISGFASSIGTKKEIERVRKRMGIHPLTKSDLKKMKK